MDCKCSKEEYSESFQEIIKKPLYEKFYKDIKKLAEVKSDKLNFNMLVKDLVKEVNDRREEILNFFFVTWLACQEDKHLKKEIIRSILKHEAIVIDQKIIHDGFRLKVSFESKYDNKIGKYKGPTL